jgi:hypothetical protein
VGLWEGNIENALGEWTIWKSDAEELKNHGATWNGDDADKVVKDGKRDRKVTGQGEQCRRIFSLTLLLESNGQVLWLSCLRQMSRHPEGSDDMVHR